MFVLAFDLSMERMFSRVVTDFFRFLKNVYRTPSLSEFRQISSHQRTNANPATNKPVNPEPPATLLVAAPVNVGSADDVGLPITRDTLLVTAILAVTTTLRVDVEGITAAVLVMVTLLIVVAFEPAIATILAAALYASSVLLEWCCSLMTIDMPF